MKRLILTQIVKNESKIIERCFNSTLPIVDAWVVCDTGSTDNTIDVIQNLIDTKLNGKGCVYNESWINFGHNRTKSFIRTQEYCEEQGWALDETWALLIDADMILKIESSFEKDNLSHSSYRCIQRNRSISYSNTRLICLGEKMSDGSIRRLDFKCISPTHEFWSSPKPNDIKDLNDLHIDDIGDGNCKSDKYVRDIRLLKQGLIDEPNNSRYFFYLGQSYRDLNQYDEALEWYMKRVNAMGWDEERWYAMVEAAKCLWNLNRHQDSINGFMKAYEMRPTRAEPLYHLSVRLRHARREASAFVFAMQAKSIKYPENDKLFVEHNVYNFLADFEVSVCAFYAKANVVGLESCERLLENPDVPSQIKKLTRQNKKFYL
jgi:tetratricopeptide (TPR) repeat protein